LAVLTATVNSIVTGNRRWRMTIRNWSIGCKLLAVLIALAVAIVFSAPVDSYAAGKAQDKGVYAKSIKTNKGKLSPKFSAKKGSYKISLTASQTSAKVTLAKADKKAKLYARIAGSKYKLVKGAKASLLVKVGKGASKKAYFKIVAANKKANKVYTVTISRAANAPGDSTPPPGETPNPPAPAPALAAPVYNHGVTAVTHASAHIEWYPVPYAAGYEVHRSTSEAGPYVVIGETAGLLFDDTGLADGAEYFYKVRAYAAPSGQRYYGEFSAAQRIATPRKEPQIAFVARNPVTQGLYENGFFCGSRINFDLIVIDDAGRTEIEITESSGGTKNGTTRYMTQTRVIPISGSGTYNLSQEIWNANAAYANQTTFTYKVSAHGESYSRDFTGCYSSYNGAWSHSFGLL
jgi:hypothetical protein